MSAVVLIVDDEIDIQSSLSFALKDEGYEVLTASSPREAEKILSEIHVDIGLYDVWFPEGDGIDLLKFSHNTYPDVSVVMMSGHGNIELALKSIRLGAYDFLEKPLELEKVLLVLKNAMESRQLRDENARLLETILKKGQIIGHSKSILSMKDEIEKESKLSSPLIIVGEPGSGRELSARVLHQISARRSKPFVSVSPSAAGTEEQRILLFGAEKNIHNTSHRHVGACEASGEGTLWIENFEGWSSEVISELFEVLKGKSFSRLGGSQKLKFEARVIFCMTSESLKKHADHLFLTGCHRVEVPSLKDRREDTVELAKYFISEFSVSVSPKQISFEPELESWFLTYDWPGNVRELKNLTERMVITAPGRVSFGIADLPEEFQAMALVSGFEAVGVFDSELFVKNSQKTLRELRSIFEKSLLQSRIDLFDGNVTKAADSLGIERAHLHRKLKAYGIVPTRDGL